jgi:hypothetical protein
MASELYAEDPSTRLRAAGRLTGRQRRGLERDLAEWPPDSPGALNAWLLLVTTKPPNWRDPYVLWRDLPLALGDPHEGFFYPDPLGFWSEVRHWASVITGQPMTEALGVTTLLHGAQYLELARRLMQPHVVLFLDEPAWKESGWTADITPFDIPDPYRSGQTYEGWWGQTPDGITVGKAPQHPAAHKLYRRLDMDRFLSSPGRTVRMRSR